MFKEYSLLSYIGVFLLFVTNNPNLLAQQPFWVTNRPVNKNYFIGIGAVEKSSLNYSEKAKEIALTQIATDISVTISNQVLRKITEKNNKITEEFYSQIETSTKSELEGYELVDTWQDNKEYWVYYRLSKDYYKNLEKSRYNKAVNSAFDYYLKANHYMNQGEIEKSLSCYFSSISSVERYLYKPIQISYNGSNIYLIHELSNSLKLLLNKIHIYFNSSSCNIKIGKPINNQIYIKTTIDNSDNISNTIYNLPISFHFIKGNGEIIGDPYTNIAGVSKIEHLLILSPQKTQIIEAKLNIGKYYKKSKLENNIFFTEFLKNITIPKTELLINVKKIKLHINCTENHSSKALLVCPQIKEFFSTNGCVFVENSKDADFNIEIDINFRNGTQMYNLYSCFADATITIFQNNGTEIYKNTITGIKGIGIDTNKANINASNHIAKKVIGDIQKNAFNGLFKQNNINN